MRGTHKPEVSGSIPSATILVDVPLLSTGGPQKGKWLHLEKKRRWNVRIRSNHHRTISKTFINKDDAIKYARETEAKIQRGLFEDLEQHHR